MTAAIGLLGGCCGPCVAASCTLNERVLYVQVIWAGTQIIQYGPTPSGFDPGTAYLVATQVVDYAAIPSLSMAAASATTVTTWNRYTNASAAVTTYSPSESDFNTRAAGQPGGFTETVTSNTNTVYAYTYTNGGLGVTATLTTTLSSPNSVSDVNTACNALWASYTVTAIAWNATWVVYQNADGSSSHTVSGAGGTNSMVAMNQPCDVTNYPSEPYSQPGAYCVIASGQIEANSGFWVYSQDDYTAAVSGCVYTCLAAGSPLLTYSFSPPATAIAKMYNVGFTVVGPGECLPNTVASPCDGSPCPTC